MWGFLEATFFAENRIFGYEHLICRSDIVRKRGVLRYHDCQGIITCFFFQESIGVRQLEVRGGLVSGCWRDWHYQVEVTHLDVATNARLPLRFQMSPQITCLNRCNVTLVTFVWFFFTVHFQMCHHIIYDIWFILPVWEDVNSHWKVYKSLATKEKRAQKIKEIFHEKNN